MSLTPTQQQAVEARGNVLVMAGAGTGKTSTLVARCLHCLLEENPPASLDQLLLITFTDAAATDMRRRIRLEFEKRLEKSRALPSVSDALSLIDGPANSIPLPGPHTQLRDQNQREAWLVEQLAIFDTAHIGTLHSFCLQLVRQNFHQLGLDPQLAVMAEEEARFQANETLEDILQKHYEGKTEGGAAIQALIQQERSGSDQPIRDLVLKLHDYSQTLRDPAGWFADQLAVFASDKPDRWQEWLKEGFAHWRDQCVAELQSIAGENSKAAECAGILERLAVTPTRTASAACLEQLKSASGEWPKGKKGRLAKPLKRFFEEIEFLRSITCVPANGLDPLEEDWNWLRPHILALLRLTSEFSQAYATAKRELGVVDFHDLEQSALDLLWNRETRQPSAIALECQKQLRFVFVDEYQDINDAQDAIIKALSREGAEANRFLVGDVKQSIYRFRLAAPHIFQNYLRTWSVADGIVLPLVDNFRSREGLLKFINSVFGVLMRPEVGGVAYDEMAELQFGAPVERYPLSLAGDSEPRVELQLRLKGAGESDAGDDEETARDASTVALMNLEEAEKEARLVALRLQELVKKQHPVWDEFAKSFRPCAWKDCAVLLRSPSSKAEAFAKEFTRAGVPLMVGRSGFYETTEISDLMSLLHLLDNPFQDVPLLAVLHSPLVGLTLDELAELRLTELRTPLWLALQKYAGSQPGLPGPDKASRFLLKYKEWRQLARQISLSRCLEAVLKDTLYSEWLQAQDRGEQKASNVQRLVSLANQFDQFQRQGLYRFLKFVKSQQEAQSEPDVAFVAEENSVSLMSIHQSKGLEFPIVVVADLGKSFNLSDLRAEIILDEKYGLCPHIKPPQSGQRYPSLTYWLARQRQKEEMLGEELRLLYVAMSRARDTLILSGTMSPRDFENKWLESLSPAVGKVSSREDTSDLTALPSTRSILGASNYLDWLALWLRHFPAAPGATAAGPGKLFSFVVHQDDQSLLGNLTAPESAGSEGDSNPAMDAKDWQLLLRRINWNYAYAEATKRPAKATVTQLRRQMESDVDEEASLASLPIRPFTATPSRSKLAASEVGTAHHAFLRWLNLDHAGSLEGLRQENQRLLAEKLLTEEESRAINLRSIAGFWQSPLGQRILSQRAYVRRELPFTARFASAEPQETPFSEPDFFDDEFVVLQGVVDLAVILPEEIWVVDFKTDHFDPADLESKKAQYAIQLRLYGQALSGIYRRPARELHLHFLSLNRSVSIDSL